MQELEGITLGHYLIQRQLARGGMSEIYLAQDLQTQQMVAIKLVHTSAGADCERFRREIKAITELKHEHILSALDYGEYGSWCYLVTPYIAYGTLHDRLVHGPLSVEETGHILTQLASALQFAHEHGVVHRDIKPSNVLLREGYYVYLADFGLVKREVEECSLTQTGYLIGTPEYLAPELVESPATMTSDLYALGILLYQMLTGRVPFKASTPIATIWQHVYTQPELPSLVNPALPCALEHVVVRALAKNPQARFQTAHELVQAYQEALNSQAQISLAPPSPEEETLPDAIEVAAVVHRHKTRSFARLLVAMVSLGVLCVGLLFGLFASSLGTHGSSATQLNTTVSGTLLSTQTVAPTVAPSPTPISQHQGLTTGSGHDGGSCQNSGSGHDGGSGYDGGSCQNGGK